MGQESINQSGNQAILLVTILEQFPVQSLSVTNTCRHTACHVSDSLLKQFKLEFHGCASLSSMGSLKCQSYVIKIPYHHTVNDEPLMCCCHSNRLIYDQMMTSMYVLLFSCRHVQVSNDEALEFYQKFGFSIVDTKEQYYKRIDPPHAFVLQRDLKGPLGPIDS